MKQTKFKLFGYKTKTDEYWIWQDIKRRCLDKRRNNWERYGGAGVVIAKEFMVFENFYKHIGPRPTKKHQVDRIDNGKGYEPGNVRWVTFLENQRNKDNTLKIEYGGRTWTIGEIAKKAGVTRMAIWFRIQKKATPEMLFAKYRRFKEPKKASRAPQFDCEI